MTRPLRAWWAGRSLREQRLLIVMTALAALVLAWLLVIRPLGDALALARERHAQAVVRLAETRAHADRLAGLGGGRPAAPAEPIHLFLSRSASDAGFRPNRVQPTGPNEATLAFDAVRPQAFFGWLSLAESRGLRIQRLNAVPNRDQTVSVEVGFEREGGR